MAQIDLTVPDLWGYKDIPVIAVLVAPGEVIVKGAPLVALGSGKVKMEIPASSGGVVRELRVKIGEKVSRGTLLATIETDEPNPVTAAPGDYHDEVRERFRSLVYDDVFRDNDRWKALAATIDESFPDPLENPETVAFGAALLDMAVKFESEQGIPRSDFLTNGERRACELSSAMGRIAGEVQPALQALAADLKIDVGTDEKSSANELFRATRLLALYRQSAADDRERIFDLMGYSLEKRIGLIAKLLAYMERGFSRAESLEYLRRRAFVPEAVAEQALARNVIAEGYASTEASARRLVHALRAAHLPDEGIAEAWAAAGFDPQLIDQALASWD